MGGSRGTRDLASRGLLALARIASTPRRESHKLSHSQHRAPGHARRFPPGGENFAAQGKEGEKVPKDNFLLGVGTIAGHHHGFAESIIDWVRFGGERFMAD